MVKSKKYKIMAHPEKCIFCQDCVMACSMFHEDGRTSLANARLKIRRSIDDNIVSMVICRHCKNPKCMDDCPPEAMSLNNNGIVVIDEQLCTSCGNCQRNCPFGAIIYIKERNRYQKCDLCEKRSGGPICVEICPVNALELKIREK